MGTSGPVLKTLGTRLFFGAQLMIDVSNLTLAFKRNDDSPIRSGAPDRAYVDRPQGLVVMIYENGAPLCDGTPWSGALQVGVKLTKAKRIEDLDAPNCYVPITWDDLQAIKDRFWPEQIAVEIFPPKKKIVNQANMRWLWVLPRGASLPFNLNNPTQLLTSE